MELKRLGVIANNLANFSTPGFKEDKPYFKSFFEAGDRGKQMAESGLNRKLQSLTNYSPGIIRHSGHDTDMAIEGDGFFFFF